MNVVNSEIFLKRKGRFEFKFLLPTSTAHKIRERLSHFMTLDPHASERGFYFNRSLYFDTRNFIEYTDYVNGEKRRRKVRLRRYALDSDFMNFEFKHKLNRIIWKDKTRCSYEEALDVCANPWRWLDDDRLGPVAEKLTHRHYDPKLTVVYQRIPLTDMIDGAVRITFDYNIRCGFPEMFLREAHSSDLRVLAPGFEVMEAKFRGAVPNWYRKILSDYQLSACTYSKYALAVNRLYRNETLIEDVAAYG